MVISRSFKKIMNQFILTNRKILFMETNSNTNEG